MTKVIHHDRWLVPTDTHCCVIDVETYPGLHDDWNFVTVGILSNHASAWRQMWSTRIRNAWYMLRGMPDPVVEIDSLEVMDNFIEALVEAKILAFGPVKEVRIKSNVV